MKTKKPVSRGLRFFGQKRFFSGSRTHTTWPHPYVFVHESTSHGTRAFTGLPIGEFPNDAGIIF
ncbi:hypothetical protein [Peribacillus glennii]|uniref:Uncharacterized protein n=1 Tax=Peribacillus glennii TaxID=2303991 RepID=A0A372LE93_9BACI|nr:hypothetical protein [Peribacillus glennii]RFU63976.1 hypothetical protein D0466_11050 [Peribacillus glennii]